MTGEWGIGADGKATYADRPDHEIGLKTRLDEAEDLLNRAMSILATMSEDPLADDPDLFVHYGQYFGVQVDR